MEERQKIIKKEKRIVGNKNMDIEEFMTQAREERMKKKHEIWKPKCT